MQAGWRYSISLHKYFKSRNIEPYCVRKRALLFVPLIPMGAGCHALHRATVEAAARTTGSLGIIKFYPLAPEIWRSASTPVGTCRAYAPVAGNFVCHNLVLLFYLYRRFRYIFQLILEGSKLNPLFFAITLNMLRNLIFWVVYGLLLKSTWIDANPIIVRESPYFMLAKRKEHTLGPIPTT